MRFFDLDGTLIDSNGIWVDVDLEFLRRRGLEPTREYADTVGHSIFPLAAEFTREYYHLDMSAQAIMDEWLEMARKAYAQVPLKPGAAGFLAQCSRLGEPMALLTACVPELCRTALARHGLERYFQTLIFAQELGMTKREPQIFLQAAQMVGADPAQCTMYEDSPGACAAARQAGFYVVGVRDPFYEIYEDAMRATCNRYIDSFTDLL